VKTQNFGFWQHDFTYVPSENWSQRQLNSEVT
jgi:hypothetical protein